MKFQWLAAICLGGALGAACGGISSPSGNTSVDISGTLAVAGYNSHPFTASKNGEFTVRLKAVSPDATALLGLGFGQMAINNVCSPFGGYTTITRLNGPTPFGGPVPVQKGTFCIAVYDPQAPLLTQPENYTLTLTHP